MLNINHLTPARIIASLPCKIVWGNLMQPPSKKSLYHQGFFAVKRRAVFILGAKWKALVRGWWRDCVVCGMETHFQWRKAHSRTTKCEAFHFAPRLFFMFLFFIPIHVHNLSPSIYPQTPSNRAIVGGKGGKHCKGAKMCHYFTLTYREKEKSS